MFVLHCSTRRPFLLALAALGAILWAGVCRADNPPPAPAVDWHKLVLNYAMANDVMKIMHWDATNSGQNLPKGVTRIYALSDDNTLLVQATPDGFTQVREIVKNLDIAPHPVRLKVQFVRARIADVKAFLPPADQSVKDEASNLLADLLQKGNTVVLSRTTETTNHAPVSFLFQADVLRPDGNVETVHTDLEVSPFPNSDDTVTLSVLPTNLDTAPAAPHPPEGTPPSTQAHLQSLRTVRNGETVIYSNLLHGKETELLVFITPTILPPSPPRPEKTNTESAAPDLQWHTMILKHALPKTILSIMHWRPEDKPIPASPNEPFPVNPLPEGVNRVSADDARHALLIEATPDGFTRMQDIVKNMDIVPRDIQFRIQFVRTSNANLEEELQRLLPRPYERGSELLADLLRKDGTTVETQTVTGSTPSSVPASAMFQVPVPLKSGGVLPIGIMVQIGSGLKRDGTISLVPIIKIADMASLTAPKKMQKQPPSSPASLPTTRTVHLGDTAAMGLNRGQEIEWLLFITPTLLPQESNLGNESGQKGGMIQGVPKVSVAP